MIAPSASANLPALPMGADLASFFRSERWRVRFDDEILAAARSLVSKCRQLRLEAGDATLLAAEVAGETAQIDLWSEDGSWEFESQCSCDTGSFCHHAAALLLRAAKERDLAKYEGRSISEAVAAVLPVEEAEEPLPDLPQLRLEPQFELRVTREAVDRQTRMLLASLGQPEPESWIFAEATAIYGEHRFSLRSAMPHWTSGVREKGAPVLLMHDAAAENAATQQLRDTGLSSLQSNPAWKFLLQRKSREKSEAADRWFPDPSRMAIDAFWFQFRGDWVARLEELGWKVTVDDNVGHRVYEAEPARWDSRLDDVGGGWFSLSVGFEVGEKQYDLLPILARLLESDFLDESLDRPEAGHVYAPLPNGDALKLPIGRVRKILHHLAALLEPPFTGRTRVHALDAVALASQGLSVAAPPSLERLADTARGTKKIEPAEPPEGLQATLRDYQNAGFQWMQFLARHSLNGILADDMGLGKTLQTIAHVLAEKQAGHAKGLPSLVIAPTSVVPNWRAEIAKFAPSLRVLILSGPDRKTYHRSIPHADVVITSFALLQRDIDLLENISFHLVVLDEAQQIKNPKAKVAQAACRLKSNHRLCLSGTPVENHLGELWSLMHFLMPGYLGSEDAFQHSFRTPIEKDGDPERNGVLKHRIAPLVLRRTKDEVAKELPPKTELVHLIELHTGQKDLYETVRATMDKRVRQAIAARGFGQSQIVFLDALLKLRQICCDPRLLPETFQRDAKESAKLDFLTELLGVLIEEGRRILLFSQFTGMLELIEEHLAANQIAYLKLTGASKDRGKLVEDFQTGKAHVFLISLKAGGTGLNLTAADTVIHYDPWWNPAAEAQATDRAYRIGQDKPVFVHKLLCQNTVEERIHKLQQDKGKLAADLLADSGRAATLDPSLVRTLLEE